MLSGFTLDGIAKLFVGVVAAIHPVDGIWVHTHFSSSTSSVYRPLSRRTPTDSGLLATKET
jgi:hypothetical protein